MPSDVIIGDYVDIFEDKRVINLSFSLPVMEVMNFWSRCGLIANFGAAYMSVAHPSKNNIANSLSFILNELIENAVKYAEPRESIIELSILERGTTVVIEIANPVVKDQLGLLTEMAKNLTDREYVNAKYIDLLTASGKSSGKSGIGLLTIINYYQASLSFRISSAAEDGSTAKYSVQTKINLEEL
jgi:hypothetical protein